MIPKKTMNMTKVDNNQYIYIRINKRRNSVKGKRYIFFVLFCFVFVKLQRREK